MRKPLVPIGHIAHICHEANRAYCATIGDKTQPCWEDAPDWQRSSAVDGVLFHLKNPGAGPEGSHNNWLKTKQEEGWVWGEVKDAEAKTHPCIVPYKDLPETQQMKDFIFVGIVHSLSADA